MLWQFESTPAPGCEVYLFCFVVGSVCLGALWLQTTAWSASPDFIVLFGFFPHLLNFHHLIVSFNSGLKHTAWTKTSTYWQTKSQVHTSLRSMWKHALIDIPLISGWESSKGSKTVCLHRGILKSSLPPSSDLGCQPAAGSYLDKVLLQTWDLFSDTEPCIMLAGRHQDTVYVFYSCALHLIES